MNKFASYISNYFQKDLSHYPELHQKRAKSFDYTITMAGSVLYHDTPDVPRQIDWRLF